jgi:hypothetical protein
MVGSLLSKHKTLISNPSTAPPNKQIFINFPQQHVTKRILMYVSYSSKIASFVFKNQNV